MKAKTITFNKGVFVISLDTELAWGSLDNLKEFQSRVKYFTKTRKMIDSLLNIFEKYRISGTWGVVGYLFEDGKLNIKEHIFNKKNPCLIDEEIDRKFSKIGKNFLNDDELWFGKDIIKRILDCKVKQEIASHSYTHTVFNDFVDRKIIKWELFNAIKAANKNNIKFKSFIFPKNIIGFLDELKEMNFSCYRSYELNWYSNFPKFFKKICHIIDQSFSVAPPVGLPSYKDGLVSIPTSMLYLSRNGFRRFVTIRSRVIKAQKGICNAIRQKKIFHIWLHPFNIATDPSGMLHGLEEIFKFLNLRRKKGEIEVMTMNEISNHIHLMKN